LSQYDIVFRVCPEISDANFGVEAPVRQGARRANTSRIQPTSNTAGQDESASKFASVIYGRALI